MTRMRMALSAALVTLAAATGTAADDDFLIRGCVTSATAPNVITPSNFFWSRSDIMLAAAEARPDAVPMTGRVFYLARRRRRPRAVPRSARRDQGRTEGHREGQGEDRPCDGFVKVKLDLDGKEEEAKVPAAWVGAWGDKDQKFDIAVRKIDVDKVKVLGPCGS